MSDVPISRPPTPFERGSASVFRGLTMAAALVTVLAIAYIVLQISFAASPAMRDHGLSFITGSVWDAGKNTYGILPAIWGTLYSSVLGVLIGSLFGVAVAIVLTQDFLPHWAEAFL